jgi:hypothetical protein
MLKLAMASTASLTHVYCRIPCNHSTSLKKAAKQPQTGATN